MDQKFWAHFDAVRRSVEQATSSTSMAKLASSLEVARRLTSSLDFETVSSALAAREQLLRDFERLSTNSALVGETIATALARSSGLVDLTSPVFSSLQLQPPTVYNVTVPEFPLLASRIDELAHLNEAVTGAMNSIHFDHLASLDCGLGRRLAGLSDWYRDIFTHLPDVDYAVPGFVTVLPARDLIVKSIIVSSRATDFEPSEAQIDLDDPAYARSDVDLMLAELNPDYVVVLDEAFEVFSGRLLGRTRHVLVSLRELITHVLHDLSPDDELRAWSTDPKYFHKDRPTRAARHLYICRFVNCGPYSDYVKKSSGTTSAFFEALNGLHDVRPDVCDFQLRLMVTDALSILRFLLRTAKHRP